MTESVWLGCPYCGEDFETTVDCSAGNQHYIEDCPVCCRPIEVSVNIHPDGKLANVTTGRDDD